MFSSLLKELRKKSGMTQGQLAKKAGVSPGNVGDWETGKSKPGYNALITLARIFEVSADYLLELNNSHPKQADPLPDNKREQEFLHDGKPLSKIETDLVAMFRLLPPMRQEEFFDLLHYQYERYVERKKTSIYWTYFEEDNETNKKSDTSAIAKVSDSIA